MMLAAISMIFVFVSSLLVQISAVPSLNVSFIDRELLFIQTPDKYLPALPFMFEMESSCLKFIVGKYR